MGFVPHAASWSIIACHFFRSTIEGDPPTFVWSIIFFLFILDFVFAVVQFLQFTRDKVMKGFLRAEFAYIMLSIVSKQLLAWINFGGAQSYK